MTARYLIGDVFDRLAELPDGSVDLVLTSPPFLALRSYLPDGHPEKHREIGSEPTPAAFIDTLLALSAEWRRVLAPHGSIAVELGDTYAGNGQASAGEGRLGRVGMDRGEGGFSGRSTHGAGGGAGWPHDKCLAMVPELYRVALAYGLNPLTGEPSPAGRWRCRNVVRWVRPNPPVGALGDKFRPATSEMVVACVARDRFFDLDAVRTPHTEPEAARQLGGRKSPEGGDWTCDEASGQNPAGAPPLDWWKIAPTGYRGSHYATFPEALCVRPIKAMCPRQVCTVCGEPSRRIVETEPVADDGRTRDPVRLADYGGDRHGDRGRSAATVGWSDCGHDSWRRGLVLDPFAGSGTTLAVATGLGRDAIGIDLDERNADLAVERVGMFLHVEAAA